MRHHVDDAGWEPGFLHDLRQDQPGRDRRQFGRLDDHRVAGGDRRDDGAPRQDVGAVPRRETGHYAQRAAHADGMEAGLVGLEDFALGLVHPARGLFDGRRHQVLLEGRERDGAAGLDGQDLGDLGTPTLDDLGGLVEQARTFGRGRLRPGGERLGSRFHGGLRLRAAASGNACIETAVIRPVDVEQLVALGRAPFATGEIAIFGDPVHGGHATNVAHVDSPKVEDLGLVVTDTCLGIRCITALASFSHVA